MGLDARVTGVMFDWDGVLLDSLGASFKIYNVIFSRIGTKRLTKTEFLALQSPNWYDFYVKVGLPASLWKRVDADWVRLYQNERPGLHRDAMKCLSDLRAAGFKLALVSNGSKPRVENELGEFGLRPLFESVVCGEKREELKPSPVMLEGTLRVLGLPPEGAVYVGDSPADVQAAKNAGVKSIAIAREPIQADRLRAEEPDHIFGGLSEMTRFIIGGSEIRGSSF